MEQERIKRRTLPPTFWTQFCHFVHPLEMSKLIGNHLLRSLGMMNPPPPCIALDRRAAPAIFHGGEISSHPLSAPVEVVHHQSFSAGSSNCIHRGPAFWASRVWPIVFWKFWPYSIICQTFDLSRVSLNRPQFFVVKLLLRLLDYCDHDAAFLTGS